MRRFKVLDLIVLGFEDGPMQCDAYVEQGDFLESDGQTLWAVWTKDNKRAESITTPTLIDVCLREGVIEEIL